MSELPIPFEPIVAVPPEKVATSKTVPSYTGVALLATRLLASGAGAGGFCTVKVAGLLVTLPAELVTTTVKTVPDWLAAVALVV
jgi:hypothetical protein